METIREYIDLFHEATFGDFSKPKREVVDIVPKKQVKYQSDFESFNQFFADIIDPVNEMVSSYLCQNRSLIQFNTHVQASLIVVLKSYQILSQQG